MTQIYLIRHGEAEGNIFRRLHGQYDSLLTPRGHMQVECVKKRFENIHIDACYASDLTRASLTSRSIYLPKGLEVHRDSRFRELQVGRWEDLPYVYMYRFEREDLRCFDANPPAWHVDGSERFDDYTQRFLEGMVEAAQAYDGGTVAIFAHGAVIRGTLMRLFFMDDITKLPYRDNTGVSKLTYHQGTFTYEFLNDNSHLPQNLTSRYVRRWWQKTGNRDEADLYHLPAEQVKLPGELALRDTDRSCTVIAAMMVDKPVGVIRLGTAEDGVGNILGIDLLPEYHGRYYGDQILGCAYSHFRKLGCKALRAAAGEYPDDVLNRYCFDPVTRSRSIDTTVFDWRPANEKIGP